MAPNRFSSGYGALDQAVAIDDDSVRKPEVSMKLAAAVAMCAVVLFFAGRSAPTEFTHQEVLDVQAFCADGQFIGKCNTCKSCAMYEFANGGCTFFKDTYCTYCEPVANCPREQVSCTNRKDSYCQKCDCHDAITSWDDVELQHAKDLVTMGRAEEDPTGRGLLEGATFACYIATGSEEEGGDCKPCHVCEIGEFQKEACNRETNTDTVCQKCTECDVGSFVSKKCVYGFRDDGTSGDTVCSACNWCAHPETGATKGQWTEEICDAGHPLKDGSDAVCKECSTCADGEWTSGYCDAGERVTGAGGQGSDTQCARCTKCAGPDNDEEWDTALWGEEIDGPEGLCNKGQRYPDDKLWDSEYAGQFRFQKSAESFLKDELEVMTADAAVVNVRQQNGGTFIEAPFATDFPARGAAGTYYGECPYTYAPNILTDPVPHDTVCRDCPIPKDILGCNDENHDCAMWYTYPCKPQAVPILECRKATPEMCDPCGDYTYIAKRPDGTRGCVHHPGNQPDQNSVCKPCARTSQINWDNKLQKAVEKGGGMENCAMENHRCNMYGEWFKAAIGIDDRTMSRAKEYLGSVMNQAASNRCERDVRLVQKLGNCEEQQTEEACTAVLEKKPFPGYVGNGCSWDEEGLTKCVNACADVMEKMEGEVGWTETCEAVNGCSAEDARDLEQDIEKGFDMAGISHRMSLSYCATDEKAEECGGTGLCNLEACNPGFVGPNCQYLKSFTGCGTQFVAERTAKKGRKWFDDDGAMDFPLFYEGKSDGKHSPNDWIVYCMMMCEENPFCHAFEIHDGPPGTCEFGVNEGQETKDGEYKFGQEDGSLKCPPGSMSKSQDWDIEPGTTCRMYRNVQIMYSKDGNAAKNENHKQGDLTMKYDRRYDLMQTGSTKFRYDPTFDDCYINIERVSNLDEIKEQLESLESDKGYVPPAQPLCKGDDCATYDAHGCDTLRGMAWCKITEKCQDHSIFPCIPQKKLVQPRCPKDQSYCYCTGKCGTKGVDECREYNYNNANPSEQDEARKDGGVMIMAGEDHTDDCWAVGNVNFGDWGSFEGVVEAL